MSISNITNGIRTSIKDTIPLKNVKEADYPTFSERLKAATKNVNERQIVGDDATEKVMSGELGIHEAMLNLQEADVTLKLFVQVRNKVLDAYREIMRMQF